MAIARVEDARPSECKLAADAVRRVKKLKCVDTILRDDPQTMSSMVEATAELLTLARYDIAEFRAWLHTLYADPSVVAHTSELPVHRADGRQHAGGLRRLHLHNRKTPEQFDAAIRQLMSKAITTEGQVIDAFTAAGLLKPDISILSDQFLAEVRGLKHKNVAADLLEKLLKNELNIRSKRNLVQSQVFSEKLKKPPNVCSNRAISTMQVAAS